MMVYVPVIGPNRYGFGGGRAAPGVNITRPDCLRPESLRSVQIFRKQCVR